MQKKVIIIGGGLAGISAACLAVQHGYRVDLYDENSSLGGDSRSTKVQGFQFDRHPKLFPTPYLLDPLFKSTSGFAHISSQFQAVSPATQLLFADGKRIQYSTEQEAQNSAPNNRGVLTLKAEGAFQKLDSVLQEIIESSSGRKKNLWRQISKTRSMNLQQPLAPFLQQLSTDPYFQQSLLTLSALTGTTIPALQVRDLFLPALIRKSGLFVPKQGWDAIINHLQAYLLRSGVKFFLQTKLV
jgi:phytoene dehydrogenase-like protein